MTAEFKKESQQPGELPLLLTLNEDPAVFRGAMGPLRSGMWLRASVNARVEIKGHGLSKLAKRCRLQ